MKSVIGWIGLLIIAANGVSATQVTARPTATDELLANPGMGWQTFHRFADDDPNLDGLPSGSAYFRFYWSQIEPEEGKVDFGLFDEMLAHAHRAGQKFAFRVMCVGTDREYMAVPAWLKEKGCPGAEFQYGGRGTVHWAPDMDSAVFQEAHFRLIRELGARYDGHPDLDLVDIGSVGLWGEWHMSDTGIDTPSIKTRMAIIDLYRESFPTTPLVMLIGDADGLRYATENDIGWRADCLGDMGGFSKTWNHMENMYPIRMEETDSWDAWKAAPVAFETCWDMRKWHDEKWDIPFIFDYALDYHASYINNKSAPIPGGTREYVERLLRRLGYRLELREVTHSAEARPGETLTVSMAWANVGVAPPHRGDVIAVRLVSDKGDDVTVVSDVAIRGWLPADHGAEVSLTVPADAEPGAYRLDVAVVDPRRGEPVVRLPIEGRLEDGWYRVSSARIIEASR